MKNINVKIYGAGSIGNHLAQASRRMGWDVTVVDIDEAALDRMKNDVYPSRYGRWDEAIKLFKSGQEPMGNYDIIFIGTPPDSHLKLMEQHIDEKPKILHIEKPLFKPSEDEIQKARELAKKHPEVAVVSGYDHVVAESVEAVDAMLREKKIGEPLFMDVEFREHWEGFFKVHSWLAGPQDSYLGYSARGGGALSEHSHAINLWQHFAHLMGWGKVNGVFALMRMNNENGTDYDSATALNFTTEKGGFGRAIQDVITKPVRKWARIQGNNGFIEWFCNGSPEGDLIRYQLGGGNIEEKVFAKKRPDDFYRVVTHYGSILRGDFNVADSPMSFERGLDTMRVIVAAHKSRQEKTQIAV